MVLQRARRGLVAHPRWVDVSLEHTKQAFAKCWDERLKRRKTGIKHPLDRGFAEQRAFRAKPVLVFDTSHQANAVKILKNLNGTLATQADGIAELGGGKCRPLRWPLRAIWASCCIVSIE